MKKILLIGDSIRMGYDSYVRESMRNAAEVLYPSENCRFSGYVLRNIHSWADSLGAYGADAVHWNAGHWDTLRIYGDGNLTRPDVYADNILRITKRLKFLFPGAKLIFAASTPVIEEGYIKEFEWRSNADVEYFNRLAFDVVTFEGCIFNDLYSLLRGKPQEFHSDQTHYYTPEATEIIGSQVNRVLCEALGIDAALLTPPAKESLQLKTAKGDREMYEKKGHLYLEKR